MNFRKIYNTIAVVLLTMILLTACQRTELCYDHFPKVAVSFAWEKEWERDYGMSHPTTWDVNKHGFEYDYLRPGLPEWVNMVKYRNGNLDGENYLTPEGDEIVFQEQAERSFLFYNGDTEYIIFSDVASLVNARASTTQRSRSSMSYITERHPGVRSVNPPDILYAAYIDAVPTIAVHQTHPLPVKMQPLVFTYVIRYEFEHGQDYIALARGALAGMAESVYLRDGRTSEESIILLYDCEVKDYGCEVHVKSFGIPGFPDEYYGRSEGAVPERPYTLNLEVLLNNGKTKEFNFDVADQIKKQPRGGVITVKGIRIEDEENSTPIEGGGGFDVDLGGWDEVDADLPL